MWLGVALAWSGATLLLVLRECRFLPDFPTRCLLIGLWLRCAVQAFPDYTVLRSFAGFSIVALLSIATAGALVLLSRPTLFSHRRLLPFYTLLGFIVFSSGVNRLVGLNLVEELMKWVYFFGVLTLSYRAVAIFGLSRVAHALMVAFAMPVILVYFSYALGVSKLSTDGSINFIGGYFHEALVSTMIFSFICLTSLVTRRRAWLGLGMLAVGVLAIFLSNYRTTIIATLPIVGLALWMAAMRPWPMRIRPAVAAAMATAALVGVPLLLTQLPERYADIAALTANLELILKPPEEFTADERVLFNSRVLLWAQYINAYANGDVVTWLVGFGANAYHGRFHLYAHNTFVSYIYEYGAIGLAMLLYIMAANLALTLRIRDRGVGLRLAFAQIGFVLLNLAAMPLTSNEGLIIYAVLVASTWALQPRGVGAPAHGRAAHRWIPSKPPSGVTPCNGQETTFS